MKKEKTLTYNDDTHQYFLDGVEVPSVSKIVEFACDSHYGYVDPEVLKKAGEYGTALHSSLEEFETNGNVNEEFREQIEAWKKIKEENDIRIVSMEEMVTDGENFAGRYDALNHDGTIIDYKSNSSTYKKFDDKWSWQESLYSYAKFIKSNGEYQVKKYGYIIHFPKRGKTKAKLIKVMLHSKEEIELLLKFYKESLNAE